MSSAETGRTVAVCHALSHLEGVHLACGIHLPRGGEVGSDVNPCGRVVLQDAREDVCHVRQFRDRGVAVRVGVPQVEAREWDENAAVVAPAVRWAWGQVGVPGLLPRLLRSGPRLAPVRGVLPERGAGAACYGAWAGACGAAAPPHAAMNSATRAIPNSQNETFDSFIV